MDNKIEKIIQKIHCDTSDAGIMSKGSFLLTYISTSLFNLGLLLSLNFCSVVLYFLPSMTYEYVPLYIFVVEPLVHTEDSLYSKHLPIVFL